MTEPISPVDTVECVLFDLDGTLIDTLDLILESMRYTTATVLGEALPDDVLMHNVGVPLAVQLDEFAPGRGEEMLGVYREHNARMHDVLVREYPGVDDALAALSERGMRMAVVTSKLHAVAQRGLDRFSLGRFFEFLIGSDDVDRHKPDPWPLLHVAELLGVDPRACAYVGDSPHDVTAAKAAGMIAVGAEWGVAARERLVAAGADHLAGSMADVVSIFSGRESAFRVAE